MNAAKLYTLDAVIATNDEYMPRDYRTVAICLTVQEAKDLIKPYYTRKLLWIQDAGGHAAVCSPVWLLDQESVVGWSIFEVESNSLFTELTMAGGERAKQ